ncbi:MAG: hypothetical protein IKX91_01730, partial [Firmicutes bacterium]|nr:hypothetical protein [Bacillota bacterium]
MSKIYVSNFKTNERAARPYLDRLRADGHTLILAEGGAGDAGNLRKADILLVLLGEAQDLLEVKQDVNVALDRKQPVAAVYFGEPALD